MHPRGAHSIPLVNTFSEGRQNKYYRVVYPILHPFHLKKFKVFPRLYRKLNNLTMYKCVPECADIDVECAIFYDVYLTTLQLVLVRRRTSPRTSP